MQTRPISDTAKKSELVLFLLKISHGLWTISRLRPNSPASLTDNWKVTDNSSVNFHEVFFFIFCQIIAKNEEKHIMEFYG